MNKVDKALTDKQRKYAKIWVENFFGKQAKTNTEVAIAAGYAADSAYTRAYELLNPKLCPHVVKYIGELKEDWRVKNQIDPDKHMSRLNHLGQKAEEKNMIGVSLRAEELRGKVAGYYIDRQIIKNKNSIEELTREELEERMEKIANDYNLITSHDKEEHAKSKSKRNGKLHNRTKNSN
jgi:phage terminase small subunit|tara:strand:+ start:3817 stop:4353 length:537 start_codon:yes stop_codon:yes gene_type:complete